MAKVAIDAGHGINTPGKRTPAGEREWTFNNKVVLAAIKYLKQYNVSILRLDDPTGKTDVPLTTRTNKANSWGADILISVHHNANTGRWGSWTGTETYTYLGNWPKAEKLARIVQSNLVKAYGLRDRGLKKSNLHMLRESRMPAILTEGGYMDSTTDIEKLRDEKVLDAAGQAIADGVAEYFGLKKVSNKPVASKPASKPSSGYTGSSIVDYLKSIGQDSSFATRARLAAQYGISGYQGTAAQNTQLLNKIRAGKTVAKPVTATKGDQKTNSIVDYLKSIGVDSSFANRKQLAEKHGIKNYTGTAAQNSLLLKKMRG